MMRWPIIHVLLLSVFSLGAQDVQKINSKALQQLIQTADLQLLDIRTSEELSSGIIPGAKHLDYYDRDFEGQVKLLDKKKPVVLYCAVGGRSAVAARKLIALGFEEVYDLAGGVRGWSSSGLKLEGIK